MLRSPCLLRLPLHHQPHLSVSSALRTASLLSRSPLAAPRRALALAASPRRPHARAAAAPLPLLRATMASSADAAGSSGARIIDGTALAK